MKKLLFKFIIILILLIFFLSTTVCADYNGIAKFNGCRTVAWMQLEGVEVRLANTNTIARMRTQSQVNIGKMYNPVDICFVLDVSGSMRGTRIDTLNKSTKQLISNLRSRFINPELLRVSIITFTGGASLKLGFTHCTDENMQSIQSAIPSSAGGGTDIANAVRRADMLWNEPGDYADFKYTVLLTDGGSDKEEAGKAINTFKTNHPKNNFLGIMVGSREMESTLKTCKVTSYYADDTEMANTIVNGIWSYIFWYFVQIGDLCKPVEKMNVFETLDTYNAIVDNELMHGATMELGYSINIKSTEEIEKITIIDSVPDGMNYDPNTKILYHADKTNSDRWGYDSTNNTVRCEVTPTEADKYDNTLEDISIKLTLTALATSADELDYMKNTARIIIETKEGNIYDSDKLDESNGNAIISGNDTNLESAQFIVMPPFGENRLYIFELIVMILLIISLVYIARTIKNK